MVVLAVHFRQCMRDGWWDPAKGKDGTDFTASYSAGELARRGENIFDYRLSSTPGRPFIYPPMFAVFPMTLLSLLPHNGALAAFWVLNIVMLFASLWLLRTLLWPDPAASPGTTEPALVTHRGLWCRCCSWRVWRHPDTGLVLAVLVCGRFLSSNMRLGNANMYILFLIVVALCLLVRSRGFWAGIVVALATAFKVTPGLFGLYLLWSRRGWALVGGALGLVLFLVLVPGSVLGVARNFELLSAFTRHASGALTDNKDVDAASPDSVVVGWRHRLKQSYKDRAVGVSLRGTTQKLLSPSVALNRRDASEDRTVNIANLTMQQAARVADVLSLCLLVVTILLTAPRWTCQERLPLILSLGLVTTAMVLISPLTRKAHLVVLLIPVVALIALLQQDKLTGAARRWAWIGLLVLGLSGVVFSGEVVGQRLSDVINAAGTTTVSVLLVYVATAMALHGMKHAK
ncbi:MAG: glycosyltransferase family 87 protein [Planctomycetota bacterium]|nr:glycosyltransferase family 87 protein [Planctomycetota bacterium]